MKSASLSDVWKRLYKRSYETKVINLEYENVRGLGAGAVGFGGGITAICGSNGVGKTSLLYTLLAIADPESISAEKMLRLKNAKLDAHMTVGGSALNRRVVVQTDAADAVESIDAEVIWVDCPSQGPDMIKRFASVTNLDEQLEAEGGWSANEADLDALAYIVGKRYNRAETFEMDCGADGVVPYFRVTHDSVTYGTETMGLGELAAHFVYWHLRTCEPNSILLLEEPETYLAPKSQEALVDVIAAFCGEKGLWAVLTTHSPSILRRVPTDAVRFMSKVGSTLTVVTPENDSEYLPMLGVPAHKSAVVLVEDKAAQAFAKAWIGHHDPHLLQQLEISIAGSDTKVLRALEFPSVSDWLRVVGLLDGDAKSAAEEFYANKQNGENRKWPFTFLPGNCAPEQVLRQAAYDHVDEFAARIARPVPVVRTALSSLEGRDHHDWLEELPNAVGVTSFDMIVSTLLELWLDNPENVAQSTRALQEFLNCIRPVSAQ